MNTTLVFRDHLQVLIDFKVVGHSVIESKLSRIDLKNILDTSEKLPENLRYLTTIRTQVPLLLKISGSCGRLPLRQQSSDSL